MIYKFRSKATGDLIMLGPNGDQVMRLIGREPAARGIIEVAAMPAALEALHAAMAAHEAPTDAEAGGDAPDDDPAQRVSLRQRVWPMIEMLKAAAAAGEPVVWGA